MAVCLFYVSAVFYARPHLSVDPDETVQSNPECPSDGHIGVGCETTRGGWGGVTISKRTVAEVATVNYFVLYVILKIVIMPYTFSAG